MGSLTWLSGAGNWSVAANWGVVSGGDVVPGPADDVTIAAPLNYTVTLDTAAAARNVLMSAAGATLAVSGTFALGGTLTVQAGKLSASGALLAGGTYDLPGGMATIDGGTLDGVTWHGTLHVAGTVTATNGLVFGGVGGTGVGVLAVGTTSTTASLPIGVLTFTSSSTLDNVEIPLDTTNQIAVAGAGTLTLGPSATLDIVPTVRSGLGTPLFGDTDDVVVNNGTVHASKSGFTGNVRFGHDLINNSMLEVSGGFGAYVVVGGALTNAGSVLVDGPGGITAASVFNSGTISFIDSALGGSASLTIAGDYGGSGPLVFDRGASSGAGGGLTVAGTIQAGSRLVHRSGPMSISATAIDPGATIENFSTGDAIVLDGLSFSGNMNAFWSGTPAGGTLTLKDGAVTKATFHLVGIADAAQFTVYGNASATGIHTDNAVPCFVAGSRIATARGDVAVERLRPGDRVMSAFGGLVEVIWVGQRRARSWRQADAEDVWPVRIRAGALAAGVPRRDLLLSPEHAVWLDGVLVPARLLVDGVAVVREARDIVRYVHVEVPQHDVLLVEGAPCESYLDVGNRDDFDSDGSDEDAGFGQSANDIWLSRACAAQCRGGARLDAIRRRLSMRSRAA